VLGVPVEHLEVVIAVGQLVHRYGHDIVINLVAVAFVEIVTDAGAVAQEVLDGYPIVDQR
jgi:hypothetical protein